MYSPCKLGMASRTIQIDYVAKVNSYAHYCDHVIILPQTTHVST